MLFYLRKKLDFGLKKIPKINKEIWDLKF